MHIYILPQCSTTAASVLNSAGMDAQFERSCCAISRGILTRASCKEKVWNTKGMQKRGALTAEKGKNEAVQAAYWKRYWTGIT